MRSRSSLPRPVRASAATAAYAAALLGAALPFPVAAQHRAELELERRDGTPMSRVEVYDGANPILRAERELDDDPLQRIGVLAPGRWVGVDGYVSVFLEDRPERTDGGAAFEVGKGWAMLGGSVERGRDDFTGAYLKLRRPMAELGFGGGDRNGDGVAHAAVYLRGPRWSAALGGARGADGVDFEHLAATWHPVERGGAPGARLIAERRSPERYAAELMFTDRANFNHFAVWGQFGMDQFPHRKTFEAVGDPMRYVRPPIFLHGYTTGALATSVRYDRRPGTKERTVDLRVFPVRALRPEPGAGGSLPDRVLRSVMVGAFRRTDAGTTTWLGEVGLPPLLSVYLEWPDVEGADPYLFVQLRRDLPF